MKVYIRPNDQQAVPGAGDIMLLESPSAAYPLSAFVGNGVKAPEGVIDLNNLFGKNLATLLVKGGEDVRISFYRGGTLATLIHYRRIQSNSAAASVFEPVRGFFADINLDGKVDEADFAEFRKQYRTSPGDVAYNPDYKFVQSEDGRIGALDFSRFAKEYGRTALPQQ